MKARILVIDDEENIRLVFKTHLSNEGYETFTAKDFTSAVEVISKTDLDLIIADIILGGDTGIDILREVTDRAMNCPVIMITGEPNLDSAAESVRLGAFDYLPKPVRRETLLRVVNHALGQKALMDEKNRIEVENERFRRNLEAIFRSVKDAIVTVDGEMRVIEANNATEHICSVSPEEIIGKKFTDQATQCRRACHHALQETLETQKSVTDYRVECGHRHRPGQVVVLSSVPLMDQDERPVGAVLVARDVTRLTDLERELREQRQFHHIVGKSQKMQKIYKLLEYLADTETTALITGESGTGKELVAKALHHEGIRADKPLVTVNCSALAENLLESELFGHVKGSFTGAVKDKVGRFQMADGGTIFLDEIGDVSATIQLKLLRFLQEKEFERVGDSEPIKVDVRVVAATNLDLGKKVVSGGFRQDLYYRLKVVQIALPPLRERREDIPLLTDHFLHLFRKKLNKHIDGVSDQVLAMFMRYPWPGNVRELEHAVEHAFVLCQGPVITAEHLPIEFAEQFKEIIHGPERRAINGPQEVLEALTKTDWNKAKAARLLGISRPTLYQKISEYNLTKPSL